MGNPKTEQLKTKVLQLVGDEYSVLGEYPLTGGKILMKHNKCSREWMVQPTKFLREGTRCPQCRPHFGKKRLTEEEVQERIDKVHGVDEYTLITGSYSSLSKKAKIIHNKCGYIWNVQPSSIINIGTNCPKCSGNIRTRWNTETFSEKILEISNGEYVLDSDYISVNKIVDIKHVKCGRVKTLLGKEALKNRYVCEICEPKVVHSKESLGERKVRKFLESNKMQFITQYKTDECKYKRPLPFDFALVDEYGDPWAMIEFDGEQHFNRDGFFGSEYTAEYDLELQQLKDGIKDRYCDSKGIIMLRIPYTHIDRIDSILNRFFRVYKKV